MQLSLKGLKGTGAVLTRNLCLFLVYTSFFFFLFSLGKWRGGVSQGKRNEERRMRGMREREEGEEGKTPKRKKGSTLIFLSLFYISFDSKGGEGSIFLPVCISELNHCQVMLFLSLPSCLLKFLPSRMAFFPVILQPLRQTIEEILAVSLLRLVLKMRERGGGRRRDKSRVGESIRCQAGD